MYKNFFIIRDINFHNSFNIRKKIIDAWNTYV